RTNSQVVHAPWSRSSSHRFSPPGRCWRGGIGGGGGPTRPGPSGWQGAPFFRRRPPGASWGRLRRASLTRGASSMDTLGGAAGGGVGGSVVLGIWSVALEPHVRRRWPWLMVGWNRLLAGRWRAPLVGRDLLLGGLLGVATTLLFQVQTLLPNWMGLAPPMPL